MILPVEKAVDEHVGLLVVVEGSRPSLPWSRLSRRVFHEASGCEGWYCAERTEENDDEQSVCVRSRVRSVR